MNSPTEEYKYMLNVDGIWDTAFFTLFEKYMIYNLKGKDKKIEIESTDQESIIISKNGGYPIPGIVYTFIYKGPDVVVQSKKKTSQYTDLVPLIFCMNTGPGYFTGINFNVLPPKVRLNFLQSFYDVFEDFLKREVDVLSQNNKLALNKRFISYVKSEKGQKMISLFNQKNGDNYNFGYRKYLIEKVDNLRMVEYPEWKYIPFYVPKAAFRKLNQSQIYKLYGNSKRDI